MTISLTFIRAVGKGLIAAMTCAALLICGCADAGTGPTTDTRPNVGTKLRIEHDFPECGADAYCSNVGVQFDKMKLVMQERWMLFDRKVVEITITAGAFIERIDWIHPEASQQVEQVVMPLYRDFVREANAAFDFYHQQWKEVLVQLDSGAISKDEAQKRAKRLRTKLAAVRAMTEGALQFPTPGLIFQRFEIESIIDKFLNGAISKDEAKRRLKEIQHVEVDGNLEQLKEQPKTEDRVDITKLFDKWRNEIGLAMFLQRSRRGGGITSDEAEKCMTEIYAEDNRQRSDIVLSQWKNGAITRDEAEKRLMAISEAMLNACPESIRASVTTKLKALQQQQTSQAERAEHQRHAKQNPRQEHNNVVETTPLPDSFAQMEQALRDICHADDERAIQRKREASARGLEL